LTEAALKIARADWQTRDLSPRQLREALARVIVTLPVYRTYRTLNTLHDDDKRTITEAVQSARIGAPEIDSATFDFLAALFAKSRLNEAEADFVAKWQAADARRHGQGEWRTPRSIATTGSCPAMKWGHRRR